MASLEAQGHPVGVRQLDAKDMGDGRSSNQHPCVVSRRRGESPASSRAHVPREYITRLVHRPGGAPIVHDLHLPARREGPSDNLCASFQMQSLQVLEHEERTATMDAVDNEPFTTRAKLPLQPEDRR